MKILLTFFLLLFAHDNVKAMDFKQYFASDFTPVLFVTGTTLATFLFLKNLIPTYEQKQADNVEDYFLGKDCPEKQKIITNRAPIRSRLKKLYKKIFLNCHDLTSYQTNFRFLTVIKEVLPIARAEPRIREEFYETFDENLCSIACKFGDYDFLNYILSLWPSLFDERWERYLSIASLYEQSIIFDQLKQLPLNRFIGNHYVLDRIAERQKEILAHPEEFTDNKIIEKHLKDTYNYRDYDLVANFFEAKLWQRKNNNADYPILELMKKSLTDKKDAQLLLFVVAIKNKYFLLQDALKQIFEISFKSKNSNNQTLLHLAYAWPKQFAPRKLIKRLIKKNIIDINAQDDDGNTVLHTAFSAYYSGAWYDRMSAEKLAIPCLLANPSLNPNIKDNNNQTPLGIISRTDGASLIHCLFQQKNFDPLVVDVNNIPPLYVAYFLVKQAHYSYAGDSDDKGVKINIGKFMPRTIMTKQLHLIPHIIGNGFFGGWSNHFSWGTLDSLIKFCIERGGELTTKDESGWLPLDVARRQYKNHHEKEIEYADEKAKTTRKEMTYHLYLLNTPDMMRTPCHQLYFYMQDSFTKNQDTNNRIMHLYYRLTRDTNVHTAIALETKNDHDNSVKKDTLFSYIKYYKLNKNDKIQYRKKTKKQLWQVLRRSATF